MRKWILRALFALGVYVVVCSTVYRFRYPDKTETELFLELPRAMAWR